MKEEVNGMGHGLKNRRGQQIVEYLIIVAMIVAVVIAASIAMKPQMDKLLKTDSVNKIAGAGTALSAQQTEKVPGS